MVIREWRRRAGPWTTPALVMVEIVLVWSGRLRLRDAVIALIVVELLLALAVISRTTSAFRHFTSSRAEGKDAWRAAEDGLARLMPRRAVRVLLFEARLWVCCFQLILIRRHGPREGFSYHRGLQPMILIVLALVIIELGVLEIVLAAILGGSVWVWVALGVHVYAVVGVTGFLGSIRLRPHLVAPEGLRLRDGVLTDLVVPYDGVAGVRAVVQDNFGRSGFKIDRDGGSALLACGAATVRLDLRPRARIEVNGEARRAEFTHLAITADDPAGFVREVNGRLAKSAGTGRRRPGRHCGDAERGL